MTASPWPLPRPRCARPSNSMRRRPAPPCIPPSMPSSVPAVTRPTRPAAARAAISRRSTTFTTPASPSTTTSTCSAATAVRSKRWPRKPTIRRYQLAGARLALAANIVTTAFGQAQLVEQIAATEAILQAQQDQLDIAPQTLRTGRKRPDGCTGPANPGGADPRQPAVAAQQAGTGRPSAGGADGPGAGRSRHSAFHIDRFHAAWAFAVGGAVGTGAPAA